MTDDAGVYLGLALGLGVFALICYVFVRALMNLFGGRRGRVYPDGPMICTKCGTRGTPARRTKGSTLVEAFLWLLLIIPGLIYSAWRVSSRDDVCPACGHPEMIPADTPRGRSIAAT